MTKQISLIDEPEKKDVKEEDKTICKNHLYATENDLIEVVIKKTGIKVMRCRYCERYKYENKKIFQQDWEREKENVTEYYVRRTLVMGKGAKLPMNEYPPELVQAKQAVIKLKRKTDELTKPLKECVHHGKLFIDDVIKSGKSKSGIQYYKCKKCMKQLHDKHYELNKAKILIQQQVYRKENKEKIAEIKSNSWRRHKDKNLEKDNLRRKKFKQLNPEKYRERERRRVFELEDSYVRKTITNHSSIKSEDIPQSLLECKRAILQLKRGIRKRLDENKLCELEEKINVEN